jgi:hypothetical protein
MMSEEKKEFVKVKTTEHLYEVPILNTVDGIGFAVRYPEFFNGKMNRETLEAEIVKKISRPDALFAFSLNLLGGMKIDEETCDDIGMCLLFRRKPVELYKAIMVSLCANFGDCFPFLEELSATEDSPSPQKKTE